jgi:hypothetical protein
MTTLYSQAKDLLYEQYHKNYDIVCTSEFHRAYANEKLRHSLQVAGAGNGIIRHEEMFQNRSETFLDLVRSAVLLHDIFRFTEVSRWFLTGQKSDHGAEGAAMLEKHPLFADIRITLPIKHHGHMIEDFYADPLYQNITDPQLQTDVRNIIFVVRDADKIANWQILTKEFEQMRQVWLPNFQDRSTAQGQISPKVMASFTAERLSEKNAVCTNADKVLDVLSWLFDINTHYAVTYSRRLKLFEGFDRLFEILGTPLEDRLKISRVVQNYLLEHFPTDK